MQSSILRCLLRYVSERESKKAGSQRFIVYDNARAPARKRSGTAEGERKWRRERESVCAREGERERENDDTLALP